MRYGFLLAVLLTLSTSAAAACKPVSAEVREQLVERLCPYGSTSIGDLLRVLSQAGQSDPDVVFLGRLLRKAEAGQEEADFTDAELDRVGRILKTNANIRLGLRVLVLSTLFRPNELTTWCSWQDQPDDAVPAEHRDVIKNVENAVACGS